MANLDSTIARLRSLPEKEQEAIAAQIDLMLDEAGEDLLSAEQWAAIEARLDADERMRTLSALSTTGRVDGHCLG